MAGHQRAAAARTASDARFMDPSDWRDLETCLATIIPTYERVNRVMSLGQVGRWRRTVWRQIHVGDTVVELGSGPGQFAAGLPHARRFLVDPLQPMHQAARRLLSPRGHNGSGTTTGPDPGQPLRVQNEHEPGVRFVRATGEHVPLDGAIADHVVCAFSFRDFLDKRQGLAEMHRLLKPGGKAWILDVRKPTRQPMAALVGAHVRYVVPLVARAITPRRVKKAWKGDPYRAFGATYAAFGTPETYVAMAKEVGFAAAKYHTLALGGAMLIELAKAP